MGQPVPDGTRRLLGAVMTVLVLVIAGVVLFAPLPSAPPVAAPPVQSPAPTNPEPSNPDRRPTPDPTPVGPESTPISSGPGLSEPGLLLSAQLRPDGDFEVSEIVLLPEPVTGVRLAAPQITELSDGLAEASPTARTVQLSAGGQPIPVDPAEVTGPVQVTLPSGATGYELRYSLSGVTVRTSRSTPGRALSGLTPLSDALPDDLAVQVVVTGDVVRNLTCPLLEGEARSCARSGPDGSVVVPDLTFAEAAVLLQVDLERP